MPKFAASLYPEAGGVCSIRTAMPHESKAEWHSVSKLRPCHERKGEVVPKFLPNTSATQSTKMRSFVLRCRFGG